MLGIFTTDRDLVIRSWDDRLAAAVGITAAGARGKVLTKLFPDIETRGLAARFRRVIDEGVVEVLAPAFHHYLLSCPPQAPSPYFDRMQQRVTIAPLRRDGEIIGALATIEDVTARRDREKALVEDLRRPEEERRLRAAEELGGSDEAGRLAYVLGDESWRVRRAAVEGLARHTPLDTVKDLLRAMREEHNNLSVLNSALQILALSDLDTMTPLMDFLRDEDVELRIYAALLLGERHDSRAIPALMKSLNDPDVNVRYHAVEALGKLRATEAVDGLLAVAETRDFFLAFPALDALARIGESRVAERLVPFLEAPLFCAPAADALGQIGDGSVIVPLAGLLNKPDSPAPVIARALTVIHERYERCYREGAYIADLARQSIAAAGAQHLIDTILEAGVDELPSLAVVLGWLEGPAVERALTRLLGNPTVRREVLEALSRFGPRVVELIVEQLKNDDLETRKAAIIALGRIGDARVAPELAAILTDDDELIIVAAGALAKIGDRQAFESLLPLLGHPNAMVRQATVGALNSIGHPEMGEKMTILLNDPEPLVRESAVRVAGYFGYPRCHDLLLKLTGDEDENVRRTAVEHLPYLDSEEVFPALRRAIREDTPRVRAAAARAIAQIDDPGVIPCLLEALQDDDPWVRYFTAHSIGKLGNREAVTALTSLAGEDQAGQVRIAAVKALGRIGGPETVSILAAIADSPEGDLAAAALAALGHIDHPEARAHLLKTLRSPDPARRTGAVRGLGARCDVAVADTLQWIAVADTETAVSSAAVETLAAAATPEAVSALIGLTTDAGQREAAIDALAGMRDDQIAQIACGLSLPQIEIRLATIEVLLRMKRDPATEMLLKALDDPEAKVRLAAAQGFARLGSRRAERRLTALATTDPAAEVRQAARKALQ